jgi:predicted alpha/beta superfamily hydrolase
MSGRKTETRVERSRLASLVSLAGVCSVPSLAALFLQGCANVTRGPDVASAAATSGQFVSYASFPSRVVTARRVVVWLPDGYTTTTERYSVLYMHDGQNLFDPATATAHQTWGVAEHLARMQAAGQIRKTMVVGIFNTPQRWREYAPASAIRGLSHASRLVLMRGEAEEGLAEPLAEHYLHFIVEELKPFIDQTFRSKPARPDTFIMGSSMGGLVSLYALASYPAVFGAAGCLSTHWPVSTNPAILSQPADPRAVEIAQAFVVWLQEFLPVAGIHKLYFDHGTMNLDALYAPHQQKIDRMLTQKGYRPHEDWMTQVFAGADHNETSWRDRLDIALAFLLRPA